ncbi:MAG: Nif3-like dinuclear metal center hexameric protein [Lachnospiraceae bacterium]|nr:Nif3-like dinuclear metal center hexameric protein [Lachnospiraceae bacterium]
MTVREVIDKIIQKTGVPPLPYEKTCDRLIMGDYDQPVHRIASTFMATVDVIEKAAQMGADMIITHEPTWFTGMDDTGWLQEDSVYQAKKQLIEKYHIAIWRFHDHMHMGKEDGIFRGFDREFGWENYHIPPCQGMEYFNCCYQIPETTVKELALFFKKKLNMDVIQIVGNHEAKVSRVAVLVGGGSLGLGVEEMPMQMMEKNNLDVAICGDITEWTLSAYVRDASQLGMNRAMIVLGHERSEEMGMKYLGEWLSDILPDVEVAFQDAGEPFTYL